MKSLLLSLIGATKKENAPETEISLAEQDAITKSIHGEIDGLEQLYVDEITAMLNSIKIPTTNQVTQKADLMESLGFAKTNETVSQGQRIKDEIRTAEQKAKLTKERLELINTYRLAYPTDKIIPMEEFEKVINKYNLIYAPSSAYIKDVPEKNLLEIKNAKKCSQEHTAIQKYIVVGIKLYYGASEYAKKYDFSNILIKPRETSKRGISVTNLLSHTTEYYYTEHDVKYYATSSYYADTKRYRVENFLYTDYECSDNYRAKDQVSEVISQRTGISAKVIRDHIDDVVTSAVKRDKLFISAPKPHFDLSGLANDGKEYYETQKVKVTVNKDPIAFYLLRGTKDDINYEFVRIVSKWGTSDDQSYLDPIVVNENNN